MPTTATNPKVQNDQNAPDRVTTEHIRRIRHQPHLLGHLAGKRLLTPLHSRWIRQIWDTTEDRALQAHRGSYKTTAITVIGTPWWLLFFPDTRIGLLRKRFTEAWDIATTIAATITTGPVADVFEAAHGVRPRIVRRDKSAGKITFNFKSTSTPEGSLNCFGVDTSITGAHVDKFIADDFITLRDRLSGAERDRTRQVVMEIRTNIIDPGKPTSWIGTPWHRDDAWNACPEPIRFDWRRTGLLTPEQYEAKREITTESLIAANYDLKHIADENLLFTDPQFDQWDWKVPGVVGHLDAKFKGDHTGALTFAARRQDRTIQMSGWVFYDHVDEAMDEIVAKCKKRRCRRIHIEDNADKGFVAKELRKHGVTTRTYHESTNKHIKIATYLRRDWNQIRWDLENAESDYLAQILDYQEGEIPDDAADSAASLLREASNLGATRSLYEL